MRTESIELTAVDEMLIEACGKLAAPIQKRIAELRRDLEEVNPLPKILEEHGVELPASGVRYRLEDGILVLEFDEPTSDEPTSEEPPALAPVPEIEPAACVS